MNNVILYNCMLCSGACDVALVIYTPVKCLTLADVYDFIEPFHSLAFDLKPPYT